METSAFRDTVDQAGERVSAFASDAAEKAGEYAHTAAKATGDILLLLASGLRINLRVQHLLRDQIVELLERDALRVE